MAAENLDRIREIEDLNARLNREKGEIRDRLEKEKEELRIRLEKENAELRSQLEDAQKGHWDHPSSQITGQMARNELHLLLLFYLLISRIYD